MRLVGERALVTGSTAGIGREIARHFAAEGARVVVTGRDAGRGTAVVEELAASGGHAAWVPAELSDEGACTALVDAAVDRLGGLTVLVNCAVTSAPGDGPVTEVTPASWEAILRVDLTAPFWLCRAALPHLVAAGRSSIVNLSSRQATRAGPALAAYCASKGGLEALTRSIAVDYAKHGVRANAISPGYVVNERRDAQLGPQQRARLEGMHLTRLGEAADVAHAAVWLASHESEFVTGVTVPVDGGSSIARGLVLG